MPPPVKEATPAARLPLVAEFLHTPEPAGRHCHAATLARTSEGDLVAAWYGYPDIETRDGTIVLARRKRGSPHWSAAAVVQTSPRSLGNPVLFESADGSLVLLYALLDGAYWNSARLLLTRSRDGGRTFEPPRQLTSRKGWMIRHRPLRTTEGSWLLPVYDEARKTSFVLRSSPDGMKWAAEEPFGDVPAIQPALVRAPNDALVAFFRPATDPRRIWRSVSNDDGRSFSPPRPTPLPCPLSGIAAFATPNALGIVYNHTEEHSRFPLSVSLTRDLGLSFGAPQHFENAPFEVSYPSFVDAMGGLVEGVFTYNRRMMKHVRIPAHALEEIA